MDHNREVGVEEHEQTPGEAQLGETLESPVDKNYFLCLGLDGSTFATSAHCLRF